jgi:hypothetical protein
VMDTTCSRCGQQATGYALIGDERYCHGDNDSTPTCYEQAISKGMTGDESMKSAIIEVLESHYAMWWDNDCRGCGASLVDPSTSNAYPERVDAWNAGSNRHLADEIVRSLKAVES